MTDRDRLAYARGYNAGRANKWPSHRPPVPPKAITGRLVRVLMALADGVDGELAKIDPEDEWAVNLGPLVDDARDALKSLDSYVVTGKEPAA